MCRPAATACCCLIAHKVHACVIGLVSCIDQGRQIGPVWLVGKMADADAGVDLL